MSDRLKVRPLILVVPASADDDFYRLSLQITPQPVDAGGFDLNDWPNQMALIAAKGVRVHIASIVDETHITDPIDRPAGANETYPLTGATSNPAPGTNLWKAAFTEAQFDSLATELGRPDKPQSPAPFGPAPNQIAPLIDLDVLADRLVGARIETAVARAEMLLGEKITVPLAMARPGSHDAQVSELEAWAVAAGPPGNALGQKRADFIASAREAVVEQAIAASLSGLDGPLPHWAQAKSHAMLDARNRAAILNGSPDPQLAEAVRLSTPKGNELLRSRMKSLALAVATPSAKSPLPPPPPPGPVKIGEGENERRKLAAILSYPTLARYLGMAFELSIPRADWKSAVAKALKSRGTAAYCAVSVTLGLEQLGADDSWTAFVDFTGKEDSLPSFFGPCDKDEALGKSSANQEFINGLLNLAQVDGNNNARFKLQVVDAVHSAIQQGQYAYAVLDGYQTCQEATVELTDISGGRGIKLIDLKRIKSEHHKLERQKQLADPKKIKLLFAQDLVIGFRPAVGVAVAGTTSLSVDKSRWRSLIARTVTFDSAVDPAFIQANFDAERENGHTRSPIGMNDIGHKLAPQQMFVWTGESLSAATAHSGMEAPKPADDLPVGVTIGLPKHDSALGLGLPPLRDGAAYVFGVTAMFVNGCGPTIKESITAHSAKNAHHLLGEGSAPFLFRRTERIPPPVVLLCAGTPMVQSHTLDALPGQSITTLVIRDGGIPDQRYLLPERVDFDRAEQQGAFKRGKRPIGAFTKISINRDTNSIFPLAVDGKIVPNDEAEGISKLASRGPVLEFTAPTDTKGRQYYPDRYSRGVKAFLSVQVPANANIPVGFTASFVMPGEQVIEALPVMIELGKISGANGQRVILTNKFSPDQPTKRPLPRVVIGLAPATIVNLELTSDVDHKEIISNTLIGRGLAAKWKVSDKKAEKRLSAIMKAGRIDEIQNVVKLKLVHAVKKPIKAPRNCSLVPVMITLKPNINENEKNEGNSDWNTFAVTHKSQLYKYWSAAGGSTCIFVGNVKIDAPSTGKLSFDAYWFEYGPELLSLDPKRGWVSRPQRQIARLFTATDIDGSTNRSQSAAEASDDFDLLGPDGGRRELSFSFRDGRARLLHATLIAESRFVEYYKRLPNSSSNPGEEGPHDLISDSFEVWVPCTFRPSQPNVRRITPWFSYETRQTNRDTFVFIRRTSYRIELGKDCYTSGEGEKIGLVFDANQQQGVCNYAEEALRPFASSVTRWGRDPLFEASVPEINMSPARFAGDVKMGLELFPGKDPATGVVPGTAQLDNDTSSIHVLVIGHAIDIDHTSGEFYSTIELVDQPSEKSEPYMAFVQLGLTRYQENSVKGLELSMPVGHMVQLIPRRSGEVKFNKGNSKICSIKLEGPMASSSTLEITGLLFVSGHWIPLRKDLDGPLVFKKFDTPAEGGWNIDKFDLHFSRRVKKLGLLIEEYENFPTVDGPQRRLIFGTIVDLEYAN